jgi:hypothetical protein
MEWIEEFFHVSPDGGNGATEILIMGALALVVLTISLVVVRRVRVRRRRKSMHDSSAPAVEGPDGFDDADIAPGRSAP